MDRTDTFFLMRLNPPPNHVCIRNFSHPAGKVWNAEESGINRIYINCLQTGIIRDLWEDGFEQLLEDGDVYIDISGTHLQQELLTPVHEMSVRIRAAEPAVVLTPEEVANRLLVTHEVILPAKVTDPNAAKQIFRLVMEADQDAAPGDELRSMKLRSAMYQILLTLTRCSLDQARHHLRKKEQKWSRQTAAAIAYMKAHLGEKLSVEAVARAAGDNYNHMKAVFRREVGMTMVEYLNYLRIQRVKEQFCQEDISSEQAGENAGIHDVKYLRRLFRRYTGMTMSEYRRMRREARDL